VAESNNGIHPEAVGKGGQSEARPRRFNANTGSEYCWDISETAGRREVLMVHVRESTALPTASEQELVFQTNYSEDPS